MREREREREREGVEVKINIKNLVYKPFHNWFNFLIISLPKEGERVEGEVR